MENIKEKEMVNRSGRVWAGLIIIGIGSLLMLNNFGMHLPHWLFKWSNFLIAIGLFIGFRHNFKNGAWFVLVLIGSFFTLRDVLRDYSLSHIAFPIALVVLGLYLILKPKGSFKKKGKWENINGKWQRQNEEATAASYAQEMPTGDAAAEFNHNNYIESVSIFSGTNQVIYSKNLKGGEVTAVFGGADLNLTQADFEGEIVIEVAAIFGGIKIVVPPTWQIRSEVTAVFGGVEDKRAIYAGLQESKKIVIIRGTVIFGGVEFKSY